MIRAMRRLTVTLAMLVAGFALFATPAVALPSFCTPSFSECQAFEQETNTQPFGPGAFFIAGDVVLLDATGAISDVFHIFNDFFDTGGGTGLGSMFFLYSADESNLPATLSVNHLTFAEGSHVVPTLGLAGLIETNYFSEGTLYRLFSDEASTVPEPASWQLLALAVLLMGGMLRRRLGRPRA